MKHIIYLDNNATTPVAPEVLDYTTKILSDCFGNPSSPHFYGWQAKEVLDQAREELGKLLGTSPTCIIFTSGATEANNIILQGFCSRSKILHSGRTPHIISSKIEHSSILKTIDAISARRDETHTLLEPDSLGIISPSSLSSATASFSEPLLASIQLANNEIGSLQDLSSLVHACQGKVSLFHSDITQVIGKLPFSFKDSGIDAVSLSGHKFHAPKGIGVLAFKDESVMEKITSVYFGGTQEKSLRPGTLAVPLIAALGVAARLAQTETEKKASHLMKLAHQLYTTLLSFDPGIKLLGPGLDTGNRLPGNLNFYIPGVNGGKLCSDLATSVAFSTSSACLTSSPHGSHVLTAIGLSDTETKSVVRMGISTMNTEAEIKTASEKIISKIKKQKG
jgi:cysteine desulfurase